MYFEKPDRIPVYDSYWAEFMELWRVEKNIPEHADIADYYHNDVEIISPKENPFPGRVSELDEGEDWKISRDGWGKGESDTHPHGRQVFRMSGRGPARPLSAPRTGIRVPPARLAVSSDPHGGGAQGKAFRLREDRGPFWNSYKFKKLKGSDDIWEMKPSAQVRLLGFIHPSKEKIFVLTHGFIKKQNRTPRREIDKAERAREAFLEATEGE